MMRADYGMEPPSDEERDWYFHGLGGGQLIARTNSESQPWTMPTEYLQTDVDPDYYVHDVDEPYLIPKRYAAVGVHMESDAYLIPKIRAILPR